MLFAYPADNFFFLVTQENAVNLLEGTADFVSSQMKSGAADPEVLQGVGASLLHGISNVITAASTGAKAEDEEKAGNEDGEVEAEKEKEKSKGKVMLFLNALFSFWRYHLSVVIIRLLLRCGMS